MKKYTYGFTQTALLLAGVSSLAMLAGCNYLGIKDPFTPTRPEQKIDGGVRRMPVLNQAELQKPPAQQIVPMGPSSAGSQAAMKSDPFDYYNAKNTATPKPAPTQAQDAMDESDDGQARKPVPGNPYYSKETSETAPIAPGPQGNAASPNPPAVQNTDASAPVPLPPVPGEQPPVVDNGPQNPQQLSGATLSVQDTSGTADAMQPPSPAAPAHPPGFFDRMFGDVNQDSSMGAEQKAPYPALSSVPPTPSQFQAIKAQRQQNMEDLQKEHMQAQEEKQALDNEPSQQQPADNGGVAVQPQPGQPVMLGHAAAPVESPGPMNAQSFAAPETAPPPQPAPAPAPMYGVAVPRRGIDIVSQAQLDAQRRGNAMAPAQPVQVPVMPMAVAPAPASAPHAPQISAMPEPPSVAAPVPQVAPAGEAAAQQPESPDSGASADTGDAPAAVNTESALPSPQLLQQYKAMPPSRYLDREQSLQQQNPAAY